MQCSGTSAGSRLDDDAELEAIARYNEEDCRATLALRDWLVSIRPPGARRGLSRAAERR